MTPITIYDGILWTLLGGLFGFIGGVSVRAKNDAAPQSGRAIPRAVLRPGAASKSTRGIKEEQQQASN